MDAIAVDLNNDCQFDTRYRLPRPSEISRFGSSLISLVTREDGAKTFMELQLAHFSVKEYLISRELAEPFQYKFSEPNARGQITRICLAYLSSLMNEDSTDDIGSTDNIRDKFPLAQYSAQFWMDHAKRAESLHDVQGSISDFFGNEKQYTVWRRLFERKVTLGLSGHSCRAN